MYLLKSRNDLKKPTDIHRILQQLEHTTRDLFLSSCNRNVIILSISGCCNSVRLFRETFVHDYELFQVLRHPDITFQKRWTCFGILTSDTREYSPGFTCHDTQST
jgi:hypothetical protein